MDIKSLSDNELDAHYREANDEIARRRRVAAIPQEISALVQQGREIGVDESAMIDAVTRAPAESPESTE